MRGATVAALLALMAAPAAHAAMFEGLFAFADRDAPLSAPPEDAPPATALPPFDPEADTGACIAAIRRAEAAHGIPGNLLLAIGLQEAGMTRGGQQTVWPWTLNVEGRGLRFDTRAEAEAFLAAELAQGTESIDVGCLQINLRWHPRAFPTPAAGFDPALNADYAARFLRDLHRETGNWFDAAGQYHSATPERKAIYLAGIERHLSRLDRDAGQLDALAEAAPAAPAGGIVLAAGVRLDAALPRRMNPLHAPVRQVGAGGTGAQPAGFRRTLRALPRPSAATPEPAAHQGPALTPGPDGLVP